MSAPQRITASPRDGDRSRIRENSGNPESWQAWPVAGLRRYRGKKTQPLRACGPYNRAFQEARLLGEAGFLELNFLHGRLATSLAARLLLGRGAGHVRPGTVR